MGLFCIKVCLVLVGRIYHSHFKVLCIYIFKNIRSKYEWKGEALERVRQDTEATIDWFDNNKRQANPVKFQCINISKTEDRVFECKDIHIQPDEIVKLVGILIYNMVKFTQHVTGVIRKCGFQLKTFQITQHKNQVSYV